MGFPEGMSNDWALDVQSAQTLDFLSALKTQNSGNAVAWDLGTLTGVSAAVLSQHFKKVTVVQGEIDAWLEEQASAGAKADMIFMDLDKTCYEWIYKLVQKHDLLKPGGLLLCDNVLYRGLTAQLDAGETVEVSDSTRANAEALVRFNNLVKKDVEEGTMRSLMMPVRDGMLGVMRC